MKLKWCFSLLLIFSIFLGAIQENTFVPNQEIVLEFVDFKSAKKDIENTIFDVKEKLLKAGATNILVQETKNGALKISYYSVVNVANIKEILSEAHLLGFHHPSKKQQENFPFSKEISTYSLDVYELDTDVEISNLDNNAVLEIKFDAQRFLTNQNYASLESIQVKEAIKVFKTYYTFHKSLSIDKDNKPHCKPEVRAGPMYYNS